MSIVFKVVGPEKLLVLLDGLHSYTIGSAAWTEMKNKTEI